MKPSLKWTDKQSAAELFAFLKLNLKKIVHAVQVVVAVAVVSVAVAVASVAVADRAKVCLRGYPA